MAINVENSSNANHVQFNGQHHDERQTADLAILAEQLGALLENPLMKEEILKRLENKFDLSVLSLWALFDSDYLSDTSDNEDLQQLKQFIERHIGGIKSALDSMDRLVKGFSLEKISDRELFADEMAKVLNNMSAEDKEYVYEVLKQNKVVGIVPTPDHIQSDKDIANKLIIYVENLTEVYLKRYQDAADASTKIYTEFANLNITISEMISAASVDSSKNEISLDFVGLRDAVNKLEQTLFGDSEITKQLAGITFSAAELPIATELAQSSGLIIAGGPDTYHLAVDRSAFDNLKKAFDALTDGKDARTVPSGTLQAFQTSLESVNNKVNTDNQTLLERLRSATSQQQQSTQLFSSMLKEMFESNKNIIRNIT